jgi:transcriptional regulator with XRE-family HTH domain
VSKLLSADFGKRLKQARESKQITVRSLGKKARISPAALYNIENGTAVMVRLENALVLADELGVSREWLCWGKGPIERETI